MAYPNDRRHYMRRSAFEEPARFNRLTRKRNYSGPSRQHPHNHETTNSVLPAGQDIKHNQYLISHEYKKYIKPVSPLSQSVEPPNLETPLNEEFGNGIFKDYGNLDPKMAFKYFSKTFCTFLMQAKRDDEDVNLIREALVDVVSDREGNTKKIVSREEYLDLLKRLEQCENQSADKSVIDRITNIERRITEDSSIIHRRLERLENRIFESTSQERNEDCTRRQATSRLNSAWSMPRDYRIESADPSDPSEQLDSTGLQARLANIESRVSGDAILFRRLASLENQLSSISASPRSAPDRSFTTVTTPSQSAEVSFSEDNQLQIKEAHRHGESQSEEPLTFIIDDQGYVVVHVDGVGTLSGNEAHPGIRVWFGKDHPMNIARPMAVAATNKTAVLLATYAALTQSIEANLEKVRIHTTSDYLMRCWARISDVNDSNYKTNKGAPVKNGKYFEKIYEALQKITAKCRFLTEENKARSMTMLTIKVESD